MGYSHKTSLGCVLSLRTRVIDPHGAVQVDPTESSLLITEPYFNLPNLQEVYDQFVFEEYEFESYYRCTRSSSPRPHATVRLCCSSRGGHPVQQAIPR